ncbi:MAG: hypothetical protein ABIA63_10205 [bacterium]
MISVNLQQFMDTILFVKMNMFQHSLKIPAAGFSSCAILSLFSFLAASHNSRQYKELSWNSPDFDLYYYRANILTASGSVMAFSAVLSGVWSLTRIHKNHKIRQECRKSG